MKKFLLTGLSFIFSINLSLASHLYGGEIVLNHLNGFSYELKVVTYIDAGGVMPPQTLNVEAYAKSNSALVQTFNLPTQSIDTVPQLPTSCVISNNYITRVVTYSNTVLLDSGYNDPSGYFFLYTNCCLTGSISNIVNPSSNGITLALDFPAVQSMGASFINSSPTWAPIYPDMACIGYTKILANQATDPDGDSLLYDFYAPFNASSPAGGNLSSVAFAPGYSASSPFPNVSLDPVSGDITMNPTNAGTYAFGVKASEYRNGTLIGASYRQYHMLVTACTTNVAPASTFIAANPPGSTVNGTDIIFTGAPAEIQFESTDPTMHPMTNETWNFTSNFINWPGGVDQFNTQSLSGVQAADTISNSLSFQPNIISSTPFTVEITVTDDGCGALSSTLSFTASFTGYPRAGNPGATTVTVNASNTTVDLITHLGGTPDPGGTWIDTDNTGGLVNGVLTTDNIPNGTYTYEYVVSAPNYPNDTSYVEVTVVNMTLGLFGNGNDPQVKVFPNPSSGVLNISVPDYFEAQTMKLYDILGRKVFESKITEGVHSFDLSDLSKGVYSMEVHGNGTYKARLLIE